MNAKRTCGCSVRRGSVLNRTKDGTWRPCCIPRDDRGCRAPSRPVPSALWCIHRSARTQLTAANRSQREPLLRRLLESGCRSMTRSRA